MQGTNTGWTSMLKLVPNLNVWHEKFVAKLEVGSQINGFIWKAKKIQGLRHDLFGVMVPREVCE